MVYMSSSGLDWNPLFASWVKKRKIPPEDAGKNIKSNVTFIHSISLHKNLAILNPQKSLLNFLKC